MSDSCKRPKNPCMVCKRPVTTKTGLQCQGSCKSWIHFTCCSYTPGKIKDIKAKIIKVRCPCPDCSAQGPKEVIMNGSYTCLNKICPGNKPQKCPMKGDNKMCQQPSETSGSCKEWPGVPCGKSCKTNTQEDHNCDRRNHAIPLLCGPSPHHRSRNDCPSAPPAPPQYSPPTPRRNSSQTPRVMPSISIIENMCETVGLLSNQLNLLMCKMTDVLTPNPGENVPSEPNSCRCPKTGEKKKNQPYARP